MILIRLTLFATFGLAADAHVRYDYSACSVESASFHEMGTLHMIMRVCIQTRSLMFKRGPNDPIPPLDGLPHVSDEAAVRVKITVLQAQLIDACT